MSEDNLDLNGWKVILKATEYVDTTEMEDDFCCKDVVSDVKKYFIPFWDDAPFNFPYNVDRLTCDELVQDLEDIENDGILLWLNKYYGREWTLTPFHSGEMSNMQKIVNMILENYRDCSEYHSVNSNMGDLR
tara:strand:+ start:515 stop:910 length:396 start_codon:yes stop_codon:yes gene_type:complete